MNMEFQELNSLTVLSQTRSTREVLLARMCFSGITLHEAVNWRLADLVDESGHVSASIRTACEEDDCRLPALLNVRRVVSNYLDSLSPELPRDWPAFASRSGGHAITPRSAQRALKQACDHARIHPSITYQDIQRCGRRTREPHPRNSDSFLWQRHPPPSEHDCVFGYSQLIELANHTYVRNQSDRADMIQEAALMLVEKFSRGQYSSPAFAWDLVKREYNKNRNIPIPVGDLRWLTNSEDEIAEDESSTQSANHARVIKKLLQDQLLMLSATEREIVRGRLEGLHNVELAIMMGYSPSTVSAKYYRALNKMRAMLNNAAPD